MLSSNFSLKNSSVLRVLCLGAHGDDIEIGSGGTILRLLEEYDNVEIYWVVFGASGQRAVEAEKSANLFLANVKQKTIIIKQFRDGFFPYSGGEIKTFFEELKAGISPDIIFTHYRHDLHQDHRLVSDLTWNTWRDHLILEYEIIKYDGDLGVPNFFVELNTAQCDRKIELLMECFNSQQNKDWFNRDTFLAMLRIRGIECRASSKLAEGFYCRKAVLEVERGII